MRANLSMLYFNSIKVQLKRRPRVRALRTLCAFQFHKGTIKTEHNIASLNLSGISIP